MKAYSFLTFLMGTLCFSSVLPSVALASLASIDADLISSQSAILADAANCVNTLYQNFGLDRDTAVKSLHADHGYITFKSKLNRKDGYFVFAPQNGLLFFPNLTSKSDPDPIYVFKDLEDPSRYLRFNAGTWSSWDGAIPSKLPEPQKSDDKSFLRAFASEIKKDLSESVVDGAIRIQILNVDQQIEKLKNERAIFDEEFDAIKIKSLSTEIESLNSKKLALLSKKTDPRIELKNLQSGSCAGFYQLK